MHVGKVWDFPHDGGATVKYGKTQIAVFNFASRDEWYATQNMCPHRARVRAVARHDRRSERQAEGRLPGAQENVLAGVAANALSGEDYSVQVFPVKVDGDDVYLHLPPIEELDAEAGHREDVQRQHLSDPGKHAEESLAQTQGESLRPVRGRPDSAILADLVGEHGPQIPPFHTEGGGEAACRGGEVEEGADETFGREPRTIVSAAATAAYLIARHWPTTGPAVAVCPEFCICPAPFHA